MSTRKLPPLARQKKKGAFLAALAELGLVRDACRAVGVPVRTLYEWRARSEAFAEAMEAARAKGEQVLADSLEAALATRAREGADRGIWYQGKKIGTEKWYSDTAAIFMLKGLRPHKYMEQLVGVSVGGQHVTVKIQNFSALPAPPTSSPALPAPPALPEGAAGPHEPSQ